MIVLFHKVNHTILTQLILTQHTTKVESAIRLAMGYHYKYLISSSHNINIKYSD